MTTTTEAITLSPDQELAVDRATESIKSGSDMFSIGGLAGTGKTTVVKSIYRTLRSAGCRPAILAPTGKAAEQLRKKGLEAKTIHSAIYKFKGVSVDRKGKESPIFEERGHVVDNPDVLICDEASMISTRVFRSLQDLGVPVIYVGDHGQLAPVGGDPGIMRSPNICLETIHRQEKGSGIIDYAHDVRNRVTITPGTDKYGPDVQIIPQRRNWTVRAAVLSGPDQILVGTNFKRNQVNAFCRNRLDLTEPLHQGEPLICLRNNYDHFIFNGTIFNLEEADCNYLNAGFAPANISFEGDREDRGVRLFTGALGGVEWSSDQVPQDWVVCDYAYAITCHKSQGSEWDNVCVIAERGSWDMARWLYTAATRAKSKLIVFV